MTKIFTRTIPEMRVEGKALGRHVFHDEESKDHPAEKARTIISVEHEAFGLPLTQSVGSCTAESLVGDLQSRPDVTTALRTHPRTQSDADTLYHTETVLEGQPWPPNDPGGSGLMVCKAGKKLGWVKSYKHAFGIQHALEALVLRPVIFGVNWYTSFDQPDPKTGVVELTAGATVRGGHEILAVEIRASDQLVGFWNSWGTSFGIGGRFWMPFTVLERLLKEQGDCTVPVPA